MPAAIAALVAAAVVNATPTEAIAHYARAVATGSASELARAFQPSAMMYCTDGRTLTATYQSQWKAAIASAPPPNPVSTSIEWVDMGATSGLARLRSVRGKSIFLDYLLLARLDDGWRIVGKLCGPVEEGGARARAGIQRALDTKLHADRTWDGDLLGRASMLVRSS